MSWKHFEDQNPQLATFGKERLHRRVSYLATGFPYTIRSFDLLPLGWATRLSEPPSSVGDETAQGKTISKNGKTLTITVDGARASQGRIYDRQ